MLDDLAALGPFFAVDAHPAGAAPSALWRPFGELIAAAPAAGAGPLADRVAGTRAALAALGGLTAGDVEPRVAASAVHLSLVARLVSPALGSAVLGHPLDVRPGGLWWQEVNGGPVPLSVPAPTPRAESRRHAAGARQGSPTGHGSLTEHGWPPVEWDQLLLHEALAPVTAAIARLVPVSGRVLTGNVASAVNAAAKQVAAHRPDLAVAAWAAATRLFASPALRTEPQPPGPSFHRASCCLFYRLAPGSPTAICGDCVLTAHPPRA